MSVITLSPVANDLTHALIPDTSPAAFGHSHAKPRSRRVAHAVPQTVGADLRFSGHWFEILSDLTLLGRVGLDLGTDNVRFHQELSLAGLRVDGPLATLSGRTHALRLLLGRCHALAASPARDALELQDDLGRPQLKLTAAMAEDARLWTIVLGGIFGAAERVVPLCEPAKAPALTALTSHPLGVIQALCDDTADAPGFRDTAELTGQLALAPARLHREAEAGTASAIAVDPALVPCALRSLCEEMLPIVVTAGSDALVLRRAGAFHAFDTEGGRAWIKGDAARFELDLAAIDSAWVTGRRGTSRELRLYDADGRALAVLAAVPSACRDKPGPNCCGCGGEPRFWRSLMNALTS
ncbi:hypothetical protein [Thiohalocapsa sp. ML1]|uniref:hypothetical protein n=1 Tax=Thiohalocapsa sp. ML1 TaxID=1431688 RepID=UPI0007321256|nr:hypothetical protein [Thiohalocapsa sp. ML1]